MRLLFCCSGVAAHANEAIVGLVNARLNRSGFPGCSLFTDPNKLFSVTFPNKNRRFRVSAPPVEDDPKPFAPKIFPTSDARGPGVLVSMRSRGGSRSGDLPLKPDGLRNQNRLLKDPLHVSFRG